MSWQAAEWMDGLPYDVAKPLATRVLLKLANVAAQDGSRAWRNAWEVADELGVDRRSVQRALRELQAADLIRVGDQRAVAHLRADRRPVVYDLNFSYHRMYSQPEIPLPDEADEVESHGATGLSTAAHGATNDTTTAVPLGTNGTTYLTLNEETYVLERAQAHEEDASGAAFFEYAADASNEDAFGGSHRDAFPISEHADRAVIAAKARQSMANAIADEEERCPKRPVSPHSFTKRGECIDCGAPSPAVTNLQTGEVLI